MTDADQDEIDEIPRVTEISRNFSFDGSAGAPDAIETDARLVTRPTGLPAARHFSRAFGCPARAAATGQATRLYLR